MTTKTSIDLSDEADRLRRALAKEMGVNLAAVVEMAIRCLARREGVK